MASERDLAFTPAWKLIELIQKKEVSSVELTKLYLKRIEDLDSQLNAYLTVTADQALKDAEAADSAIQNGTATGALTGIPISIKDLNLTKGVRTTRGSLLYKDFIPHTDEPVVRKIKESGAIILGKTNTPEFGAYATTENRLGDPCVNPWNTACTAGGSSGGAAAGLAAGLHPLAQGSDGGGSIRIPGSICGVFGIKPTQGRVSRPYKGPGGWGQFSQNGPMTRTVKDTAILLQVMAGPDAEDAIALQEEPPDFSAKLGKEIKGMRIGWSPNMGSVPVDPEVRDITEKAVRVFEELGATVEEAPVSINHEVITNIFMTIWLSDYCTTHGETVKTKGDQFTDSVRGMLEEALTWPASKLASALHGLEWHRYEMDQIIKQYDLLITPTLATPAFKEGERPTVIDGQEVDPFWGFTPFTYPINMSGHTASSVPCGFNSEGLPIGLHLIGNKGEEATVLQASHAFEEARPWAHHLPPVS